MVTPFLPSAAWFGCYLRALASGSGDTDAKRRANEACGISGKGFARAPIRGCVLGVPVEGGGKTLKRTGILPVLSEHGKWRREHLGAFEAAYGKCPYYIHLRAEIEEVYRRSAGMGLEDFNAELLRIALDWTGGAGSVRGADMEVMAEKRRAVVPGLSVVDALFRLGPECVLGL